MAGDGKDLTAYFFFLFAVHEINKWTLFVFLSFSFSLSLLSHHEKVLPVKLSVLVLVKFFLSSDEAFAVSFVFLFR